MSDGQSHGAAAAAEDRERAVERHGHLTREQLLEAATVAWALAAMLRIQADALDDEMTRAEREADELQTAFFAREGL